MDSYIDLRLRPDPEFGAPMLMSALFSKLHRALVNLKANDMGASFPEHTHRPRTLGNVLRLHGEAGRLEELMKLDWLVGMRDHTTIEAFAAVPEHAQHRSVRRVQPKTSADRLRRRYSRRHRVSEQVAQERIPDSVEQKISLPFVTIRSQSTGEVFCLFIEHGPVQAKPVRGKFTGYGLSPTATVPWF